MTAYRWPIKVGDRVALAPHLDLFMAGVRYGRVVKVERVPAMFNARRFLVDCTRTGASTALTTWCWADDLLGAVSRNAVPESTDPARSSSDTNPDSVGAGWPEEG